MNQSSIAPAQSTYDVLVSERKKLFSRMNFTLMALLIGHAIIYFSIAIYSMVVILLLSGLICIPLTLYLEKKSFPLSARYLFIWTCCFILYGTSMLLQFAIPDESYYITTVVMIFLIFDPSEKKHIFINLAFPITAWILKILGYQLISEKYLLNPHNYEYFERVNFIGSLIGAVLGTNFFVSSILKLKEIGIKEEEDKRVKLEEAYVEIENGRASLISSSKLSSLGEMASGIAHEINNPLSIISATTSFARKKMDKNQLDHETIIDCFNDIDSTVDRITKIINGLRVVSRNGTDEREPTPLQEILDDVLVLCSEKFKNNSIELTIIDPDEISKSNILCSRVPFSQVLLNLLNNSFDALLPIHNETNWVRIYLRKTETLFELKFLDSGHGIPLTLQQKIFEPFFTTKEVGKGTGIGLSISKNMIEAQGGRLDLDVTNPNTCFIITIPQK